MEIKINYMSFIYNDCKCRQECLSEGKKISEEILKCVESVGLIAVSRYYKEVECGNPAEKSTLKSVFVYVPLLESHIVLDTWAEYKKATGNIGICNYSKNNQPLVYELEELFREIFKPKKYRRHFYIMEG